MSPLLSACSPSRGRRLYVAWHIYNTQNGGVRMRDETCYCSTYAGACTLYRTRCRRPWPQSRSRVCGGRGSNRMRVADKETRTRVPPCKPRHTRIVVARGRDRVSWLPSRERCMSQIKQDYGTSPRGKCDCWIGSGLGASPV